MKVTKYIEVGDHVPECSLAREGLFDLVMKGISVLLSISDDSVPWGRATGGGTRWRRRWKARQGRQLWKHNHWRGAQDRREPCPQELPSEGGGDRVRVPQLPPLHRESLCAQARHRTWSCVEVARKRSDQVSDRVQEGGQHLVGQRCRTLLE